MSNQVYNPEHYDKHTADDIDAVIDGLPSDKAAQLYNVLKYFDRRNRKGNKDQDLKKANNSAHRLVFGKWVSDGEQQTPPTKENEKKKSCMCSESHVHEPNGCAKCGSKNGPHVVQVSILQELPSNKRKWHEKAKELGIILALVLFCAWECLALYGAWQIEDENIYLNIFLVIANFSFVAVAGWFYCDRILEWLFDKL